MHTDLKTMGYAEKFQQMKKQEMIPTQWLSFLIGMVNGHPYKRIEILAVPYGR